MFKESFAFLHNIFDAGLYTIDPGLIREKNLWAQVAIAAIIVSGHCDLEPDYQFLPDFSEFFTVFHKWSIVRELQFIFQILNVKIFLSVVKQKKQY